MPGRLLLEQCLDSHHVGRSSGTPSHGGLLLGREGGGGTNSELRPGLCKELYLFTSGPPDGGTPATERGCAGNEGPTVVRCGHFCRLEGFELVAAVAECVHCGAGAPSACVGACRSVCPSPGLCCFFSGYRSCRSRFGTPRRPPAVRSASFLFFLSCPSGGKRCCLPDRSWPPLLLWPAHLHASMLRGTASATPSCTLLWVRGRVHAIPLLRAVLRIRISPEFRPNRLEPMGVGALQSNNRFRLRSGRNQSNIFQFRSPRHSIPRLEAAFTRRSVPPSFTRHFRPPRAPRTVQTINSRSEKGIRASARASARDGGGRFLSKIAFDSNNLDGFGMIGIRLQVHSTCRDEAGA